MSKKTILNSDIYNLAGLVNDLKKEYIQDESSETLNIGTYGYIGAIETKRLQSQVFMTGELCNEAFASRARLERNVITHAILSNIENINAIPAKINVKLALKEEDIKPIIDNSDNYEFILDKETKIYFGDFEFHLEYDIILSRTTLPSETENNFKYIYSARYDIPYDKNRIVPTSDIINPYIISPSIVKINKDNYVFIDAVLSQVQHYTIYKKTTTSNVIDNKTLTFSFTDQLSYFLIRINEAHNERYIVPIFEGSAIPNDVTYYCWYQFLDVNTIRIRFDRNSYMPGINAEIAIEVKTTRGDESNFKYSENQMYISLSSEKYKYRGIKSYLYPVSESEGGKNKKSKQELQRIIPREALSRGSLTNMKDLNNYFNMIDNNFGRMVIQKKIDNQIERIYYSYIVLKDRLNNIVPTNTLDIKIPFNALISTSLKESLSPRYILRSGSCFKLRKDINRSDNGRHSILCEYVEEPILNKDVSWSYITNLHKDDTLEYTFTTKFDPKDYLVTSCRAYLENNDKSKASTNYHLITKGRPSIEYYKDNFDTNRMVPIKLSKKCYIGQGCIYTVEYTYTATKDGKLEINNVLSHGLHYEGIMVHDMHDTFIPPDTNITSGVITYNNVKKDSRYNIRMDFSVIDQELEYTANIHIKNGIDDKDLDPYKFYGIILDPITQPGDNGKYKGNSKIEYKVKCKVLEENINPNLHIELSRGLDIDKFTQAKCKIGDSADLYSIDPIITDIQNTNYYYTNPYNILINHNYLYSTFYMMTTHQKPYLDFIDINRNSKVQFIALNINWRRDFLGIYKNEYRLSISLQQSINDNIGIIDKDAHEIKLKVFALLYKNNGKIPYRYVELKYNGAYEDSTRVYNFNAVLDSEDILDDENNIKISGVDSIHNENYGFFNPTTNMKIVCFTSIPNILSSGYNPVSLEMESIPNYIKGIHGWNITNIFNVVNGVNFYNNFSEIMQSKVKPYGVSNDNKLDVTDGGYIVRGVPLFGYDYCKQNEVLADEAIDILNEKKMYIDNTITKLENSFSIDFKHFNTYGPSNTFYIIRDTDNNSILDDKIEYIDKVNITLKFRVKLRNSNDGYIKNSIKKDIKNIIEDLNDIGEIHIPNIVTQINNKYSESVIYFEYLGFNNYGPDIQHLYKTKDELIPLYICPEFININNIYDEGRHLKTPDINIFVSEL